MTARNFDLPDLGEGLTEAEVVRWLVAVGDTVTLDQPIAEVETAKSIVEVPSPYAGTVTVLHGREGEVMAVGKPLITVDTGADTTTAAPVTVSDPAGERYREEERAGSGSGNVLIGYGTPKRRPRDGAAGPVTVRRRTAPAPRPRRRPVGSRW